MKKPVLLLIRDGWGINPAGRSGAEKQGDATLLASTPIHDQLYQNYPMSRLQASGLQVGLPEGQMGNSEVGHLNLGAGRIVYQELTRINLAVADHSLEKNLRARIRWGRSLAYRSFNLSYSDRLTIRPPRNLCPCHDRWTRLLSNLRPGIYR